MLYVEVETHFREDGKSTPCTAPFSLLNQHVCSTSPTRTTDIIPVSVNVSPAPDASDSTREPSKRKASAKGRESGGGKRAKTKRAVLDDEGRSTEYSAPPFLTIGEQDADMEDVSSLPQTPLAPPRQSALIPRELTNGKLVKKSKDPFVGKAELLGNHATEVCASLNTVRV